MCYCTFLKRPLNYVTPVYPKGSATEGGVWFLKEVNLAIRVEKFVASWKSMKTVLSECGKVVGEGAKIGLA